MSGTSAAIATKRKMTGWIEKRMAFISEIIKLIDSGKTKDEIIYILGSKGVARRKVLEYYECAKYDRN